MRLYDALLRAIVWVTDSGDHRHSPQTASAAGIAVDAVSQRGGRHRWLQDECRYL